MLNTSISLIVLALVVFVVMFLWNAALVPAVAILTPIGYWQALGIIVLVGLLRVRNK